MPQTPHIEKHFTAGDVVRDIVIGMSDGLTVPFALAAGLSGAVAASGIVVTAGLAEVAAGAIAMGLGGYLAARSDAEHYDHELQRERREIVEVPQDEEREVRDVLEGFGMTPEQASPVVNALRAKPEAWVDFMMRFELGLEKPQPTRARNSSLTIAASYVVGGMVPLLPYMLLAQAKNALYVSIGVTLLALLVFGYVKGRWTGGRPIRSALQTVLVGGLAAAAAFTLARLIA
jgi:VIT1/CCC1 family predicted Fe2+/Mn2+ transporter